MVEHLIDLIIPFSTFDSVLNRSGGDSLIYNRIE